MTGRCWRHGFTLVELLIVMAIITVLAGIVYATSGGAREKVRQAHCLSNLRQIGQAVAMYQQDYDISDDPGALAVQDTSSTKLEGIMIGPVMLLPYLGGNKGVFHCLNLPPSEASYGWAVSYNWNIWLGPEVPPRYPSFREAVNERGGSFPLVFDSHHNFPNTDLPIKSRFVLILRLDGSVRGHHLPLSKGDSWTW